MSDLPIAAPGQRTNYQVRLAVFEGPLDLLLHLIEREELDITRVSLSRVTDQYLEYLEAMEKLVVDDLADFVMVAARLILIKSQALLPRPPTTTPEEEDAGEELIRQLIAYKQFKQVAQQLEERHAQGQRSYIRLAPAPRIEAGIEHLDPVSLDALLVAARQALQAQLEESSRSQVVIPFTITIKDQIQLITDTLIRRPHTSFTKLLTPSYSRQEVSVTLLAVLELVKRHKILARQERMFGEIVITPASPEPA